MRARFPLGLPEGTYAFDISEVTVGFPFVVLGAVALPVYVVFVLSAVR